MTTTLIIPGLRSSGPAHWQTWIERHVPNAVRVRQADWSTANLAEWSSRIRRAISQASEPIIIVAHSFGVLAAVQAASDHDHRIAGALLVAPADPERFGVSEMLPAGPLNFPAIVVGSTNDPWMSFDQVTHWADKWGADLINLGAAGHINADAGYGPWPEGLALVDQLQRSAEFRAAQAFDARHRSRVPRLISSLNTGRSRRIRELRGADTLSLNRAAVLLERAGWRVEPPTEHTPVSGSQRQYSGSKQRGARSLESTN